jgi:5-methyltetrahydrofolate--homocysteine methyltransferase
MAKDFLERLANGEVLVAWPAVPALLEQEAGRSLDGHLAEWVVNHPDVSQRVLKAHYTAGGDIGYLGTQGNNRYRLKEFGLEDKVYELTLRQVQLAREVTPDNCYLAGIIGLAGVFLEPVGEITIDELYRSYEEQVIPMLDGGVDLFVVCDNDTEEIAIQIRAVRDHCDLPLIAMHIFFATKKGFRTLMGLDVKTASARLQEAGADVIGATCGDSSRPISNALAIVKEMRGACDKPLLIKPCAGLAQLIGGKIVQPVTPEEMANEVPGWIAAGASIVGDCCGSNLEHTKAISAAAKGKRW